MSIRMGSPRLASWVFLLAFTLFVLNAESVDVENSLVKDAAAKGAVCLDGSPPAYAVHPGVGDAANNWLVYLEGGGWCANVKECSFRSTKPLGSSMRWQKEKSSFAAILSDQQTENPYFYNWTRVFLRYCDGSSYIGDREQPVIGDNNTQLYYRGARVFKAIMDELLEKGMNKASRALLAGCSAGGLGALLQCDNFHSLFPASTKVKCVADAGYFVDGTDIYGGNMHREHFAQVAQTHELCKNLPKSCTSKMNASLCMLPENFVADIQTPVFLINSVYDPWQILNIMMPVKPDQMDVFKKFAPCGYDIENCDCDQVKHWRCFQDQFYKALTKVNSSAKNAMFVSGCSSHCHTLKPRIWFGETKLAELHGDSAESPIGLRDAMGQWVFNDAAIQAVDRLHKSPLVCDYNPEEPHWNNHYVFHASEVIIPGFTLDDEIKRKEKLVPQCPAEVLPYAENEKL